MAADSSAYGHMCVDICLYTDCVHFLAGVVAGLMLLKLALCFLWWSVWVRNGLYGL
jgi:hypothetical protein